MAQIMINIPLAVFISCLLFSCATTELTAVWKDPAFHGQINKVAIIGGFQSRPNRNIFEDEFAMSFNNSGLDAFASYTIIHFEKVGDMDYVMSRIRESGADAILETRLIDRKTEQEYVRGQWRRVPEYYHEWGHYHRYIYSPGYYVNIDYAYAETNIYTLPDRKLVWSARSKTEMSGNDEKRIRSFVRTIVERLLENGMLTN